MTVLIFATSLIALWTAVGALHMARRVTILSSKQRLMRIEMRGLRQQLAGIEDEQLSARADKRHAVTITGSSSLDTEKLVKAITDELRKGNKP